MINLMFCENPAYANAEGTLLEADVVWDVVGKKLRTGLSKDDNEPHVKALITRIESGEFGSIAPYVAPEEPVEEE
jgi:hypothetical protein